MSVGQTLGVFSVGRQRGMTLIEVLVSMAIVSMMVAGAWSMFRGTVRSMETAEQIQDRYNSIRSAMDRMSSEISMAYLSFNRPTDEVRHFTYFEGRSDRGSDSLTFSSFAHLRLRKDATESDQTIIQYYLDDDPDQSGQKNLYRREDRRLHGDLPEDVGRYVPSYVMCEDVLSLEFSYWDASREEWLDEWRTTVNDAQPGRLPPRVKIRFGVDDGDGETEYFVAQTTTVLSEKIDLSKK